MSQSSPTKSAHRLLYRGALSLPDSHILLDGLTFYAPNDNLNGTNASSTLLENPLALALESMRGRPSLRLLETVKMGDTWVDDSPPVCLEVHPLATISRMYLENMFCISPFDSQTSSCGIKVALGDTDGPETTYIVIHAKLASGDSTTVSQTLYASASSSNKCPPTIELVVSRVTTIAPAQARPTARLPRPDDPTPRRPQQLIKTVFAKKGRGGSFRDDFMQGDAVRRGMRTQSTEPPDVEMVDAPTSSTSNGWTGSGRSRSISGSSQGGGREVAIEKRGQPSVIDVDLPEPSMPPPSAEPESQLERANRNNIKQATATLLTNPPYRMRKSDADFKEVFNPIYRGVAFAMRKVIKDQALDLDVVHRLAKAHAGMYVGKRRAS